MSRWSLGPAGKIKERWHALRRSRIAFTSVLLVVVLTAGGSTAAAFGAFGRADPTRSSLSADASTAMTTQSGTVRTSRGDAVQDGALTASSTQSTAPATPADTSTVAETMSTTTSASAVSATPEPPVAPTTSVTTGALPPVTQTLNAGSSSGARGLTRSTSARSTTTESRTNTAPTKRTTAGTSSATGTTTTAATTTTRTQTSPTTSSHTSTPTQTATSTETATTPVPISLPPGAATAYAPGQTAQAPLGSPADAIDGSQRTAWTWTLDAADAGAVDAGLLLDLGRAVRLKSLTIVTGTPWMSIQVEGAAGPVPSTVTSPGWIKLAGVKALRPTATLTLGHSGTPMRHLLIWITHPPPGVNSGQLQLNAITVMPESP